MDIKTLRALNSLTEVANQITAPKSEYKARLAELMDQVTRMEALQADVDTKVQANAKLDAEIQEKLTKLEKLERSVSTREERVRKQAADNNASRVETNKLLADAQALHEERKEAVRQLDVDRRAFEKNKAETLESLAKQADELDKRAAALAEKEQRLRNAIG